MRPVPASVARLADVPWRALAAFAPELDAPLAAVLRGRPAERELDAFLRAHRGFTNDERRAASEAIFGVGLWRNRLAWHAGASAPDEVPPRHLLASLVRELAGVERGEELVGLASGEVARREEAPPDLATTYSFPPWLAATIEREAGPSAAALADALCLPGPVFLRANALVATPEAVAAALAREGIDTVPGAYARAALRVVSPRANLLGAASAREGWFEVQDEGSQLLGEAVRAEAGDVILDACAGAGGKSLQLAAAVGARGRVHACDVDAGRLTRLAARARSARAAAIVAIAGAAAPADLRVDRAMVDAPCSELGPLRRGPDVRFRIDPAQLVALPRLQLELLARAAQHVRSGGTLVYATCTFRREENDEVALAFERESAGWTRIGAHPDGRVLDENGWLRAWPHAHGTDAVFAAAWRRR